jgi:hypothetical protein
MNIPRWAIWVFIGALLIIGAMGLLTKQGSRNIVGPQPMPTPKPGETLINETFDNQFKWGTQINKDPTVEEANGKLSFQTFTPNSFFTITFLSMAGGSDTSINTAGGQTEWLKQGNIDMTFDAYVERDAGPATFGAACRYQNDQNFYLFILDTKGYFGIGRVFKGNNLLLQKGDTNATLGSQHTNKVRIICSGDQLTLAVNGTPLATVNDPLLKNGIITLIGGTGPNFPTDVLIYFDNVVIRAP